MTGKLDIPLFTNWKPIESAADVAYQRCEDTDHFRSHIQPGLDRVTAQEAVGGLFGYGAWYMDVLTPQLELKPVGLVSLDIVTSAGAAYVATAWSGGPALTALTNIGVGTGISTPASNQTELDTELEEVNAGARAVGDVSLPIPNRVRVRALSLYTGASEPVIRELGLFNSETFGSGVMFDRALTPVTPLVPLTGMSLTFMLTLMAG